MSSLNKEVVIEKLKSDLSEEDKKEIVNWYIDNYAVNTQTFGWTALYGVTPVKVITEKDKSLLNYAVSQIKKFLNEGAFISDKIS